MEPIDPIYYETRHSISLFFQFGLQAFYQKFLEYYEEEGAEVNQWYDADHYRLNKEGRSDRVEWLRRQLCLELAQ
jgi:hypothetical protein